MSGGRIWLASASQMSPAGIIADPMASPGSARRYPPGPNTSAVGRLGDLLAQNATSWRSTRISASFVSRRAADPLRARQAVGIARLSGWAVRGHAGVAVARMG